jgi:sialidase-1
MPLAPIRRHPAHFCLFLLAVLAGCSPQADTEPPAQQDSAAQADAADAVALAEPVTSLLWQGGEGGYLVYRIPALIEAPSGALLAFVEGRQSLFDHGNIDIVLRRSVDGGKTWGPPQVVVDQGEDTAGNPAPVVDPETKRIWLPFCTNPGQQDQKRQVWLTYSDDDGQSWAKPRDLTPEVKAPGWTWYATGPGRSIALASGRLVVPANHVDASGIGHSHVFYSDDHGLTWHLGGVAAPQTDESQVAELNNGDLLLSSRYEGPVFARGFSRSTDRGLTWGPLSLPSELPDPHCQGSLLNTADGLLLSHPATTQKVPRDHLTVRLSSDGGLTWPAARLLDAGPSAYSALARLPDGRLVIAWESGAVLPYDRIQVAVFSVDWLKAGKQTVQPVAP